MHSTSRRLLTSGLRTTGPASLADSNFFPAALSVPLPLLVSCRTAFDGPRSNRFRNTNSLATEKRIWGAQAVALSCLSRSTSTAGRVNDAPTDEKDALDGMGPPLTQEVKDELRQLHHIRSLVSQLYMALHVPDTYQAEMETMRKQLEEIHAELQPLEEKKIQLLMRAERRSKVLAWGGLGFMGMQFGFLARLTWWEYSWDIVEPMTYFVTYGTAMGLYAYFLVTRQDVNFPAVTERWTAVAFHKNVKRAKWEMNRYIQLKDKLAQMQQEVERMEMLLPRPRVQSTTVAPPSGEKP